MKLDITNETWDAMWQFFYKTSIPRLIAEHKEKEQAELDTREEDED